MRWSQRPLRRPPRSLLAGDGRRLHGRPVGARTAIEIVPGDIHAHAATLSGGNQQKVVLGKTFASDLDVLVIDQPTAGVDIGTKAQIHRPLRERADAGAAVLVVSDDLEELYALGDRFLILRHGQTVWEGTSADVSHKQLVQLISSG